MKLNPVLLALLSIGAAQFAHADETDAPAAAEPAAVQTQELQNVSVTGKAQRSYSIASDGDLRDRVNLGVLGVKPTPLPRRLPSSTMTNKPLTTPKRVLWWML